MKKWKHSKLIKKRTTHLSSGAWVEEDGRSRTNNNTTEQSNGKFLKSTKSTHDDHIHIFSYVNHDFCDAMLDINCCDCKKSGDIVHKKGRRDLRESLSPYGSTTTDPSNKIRRGGQECERMQILAAVDVDTEG